MIALRLVHLIETRSDELASNLMRKALASEKTSDLRKIPPEELRSRAQEIYRNLSSWLLDKTEADIARRYSHIGARRAAQGVALSHLLAAILLTKENLWEFLENEALVDNPVELFGELELLRMIDQFFDRALYYAACGHEQAAVRAGVA